MPYLFLLGSLLKFLLSSLLTKSNGPFMTAWLAIIAPAWIAGSILALLSAPLGCLVLWRRMAFCRCFSTWNATWRRVSGLVATADGHWYRYG